MYCHRCGKTLSAESLYCQRCGVQVRLTAEPDAAILAPTSPRAEIVVPEERLIFRIYPAFYAVGVTYFGAAFCSVLAAGMIGYFGGPLQTVLALAALFFLVPFYRHIRRNRVVYTLTSTKIEIEYGLLSKTIRNIPLRNIQDVTTRATFGERLIGVGDVIIDSASEAGKIPMSNIRDPRKYADLILDQLHRWD
jgi:membrane protein YdbS with pleckstrin-like domain